MDYLKYDWCSYENVRREENDYVGIFNTGETDQKVDLKALIPSENPAKTIRDLWRQRNLSESELNCTIPLHGCRYLKVW